MVQVNSIICSMDDNDVFSVYGFFIMDDDITKPLVLNAMSQLLLHHFPAFGFFTHFPAIDTWMSFCMRRMNTSKLDEDAS